MWPNCPDLPWMSHIWAYNLPPFWQLVFSYQCCFILLPHDLVSVNCNIWCSANGRSTVNLERPLDNDGDPLVITTAEAVAASGVPPWNWRETPGNGKTLFCI